MKNIPNLFSHDKEVKINLNKFRWFMSDAANDRRSLEHASVRHSRAPALSVTTAPTPRHVLRAPIRAWEVRLEIMTDKRTDDPTDGLGKFHFQ